MPDVRRLEALWTKIVGVLLILLGVTLIFSPQIAYTGREKIPHTQYSVKHEKTIVIPTLRRLRETTHFGFPKVTQAVA